jgi:type II secretory pathway pseudopilin PulG
VRYWRALVHQVAAVQGEGGYSLVELVVVMLVVSVLMVLFVPMLGVASRASATDAQLQQASAAGRIAIESIVTQVASASQVCLLDTTGAAPTASTSCPSSTTSDGVEVLTGSFGAEHYVQWWYQAPPVGSPPGTPGQLMEQSWPAGESPPQPVVTTVAGSLVDAGLSTCSVLPGPDGMFSLATSSMSRTGVTISLQVTCGEGANASSVTMQSTATALDTSP